MDSLRCPVCHQAFLSHTFRPKLLIDCGHTICSACLKEIIGKEVVRCPVFDCSVRSEKRNELDFPINDIVLKMIEERDHRGLCPVHAQLHYFLCVTDKEKLCHQCILTGIHGSHEVITITSIQEQALNYQKELRLTMLKIQKYNMKIVNILEERRQSLIQALQTYIKEIKKLLDHQECELAEEIHHFFAAQKANLSQSLGELAPLHSSVLERVIDLNAILKRDSCFERDYFLGLDQYLLTVHNIIGEDDTLDKLEEIVNSMTVLFPRLTYFSPPTMDVVDLFSGFDKKVGNLIYDPAKETI